MNISCPQPNSTTSNDSLDTSNLTNAKSRLKKLSASEKTQEAIDESNGQQSDDVLVPFEKQEENLFKEGTKASEEGNQDKPELNRKKKQQIGRRNFKTALEEEEQFGAIRKKFKVLSDSETKTSSPSLSEKESEDNPKAKLNKENKFNLNVDQSKGKSEKCDNVMQANNQNTETADKCRVKCKNLSLFYSEDKGDILFKVEYEDDKTQQTQEKLLTRKQMVDSNPLVALYYYENHLQFADAPGFRPKHLQM